MTEEQSPTPSTLSQTPTPVPQQEVTTGELPSSIHCPPGVVE